MKKISAALIIGMLILTLCTYVKAASVELSGLSGDNAKANKGQIITTHLIINGTESGVNGIQGKLQYNSNVLEYVGNKVLIDGWFVSGYNKETGIFLLEPTKVENIDSFIKESKDILEITFKVKEDAELGATNISISNIVLSGENSDNKEIVKSINIVDETNQVKEDKENNQDKIIQTDINKQNSENDDGTVIKQNKLPQTGINYNIFGIIGIIFVMIIIFYKKLRQYREI